MDYQKIYDLIITKAKSLNRKKGGDVYYELHHIIPKCMGGDNSKLNLVLLTAREHYLSHKLLYCLYPNNLNLARAFHSMIHTKRKKRNLKLTSREYEEARKAAYLSSLGENNGMYNKKHKPESIKKMSDGKIGKPSKLKGVAKTDGHKEKVRQANIGKKYSNEVNKKKGKKGNKPPVRYRKDLSEHELKTLSDRWSGENNPNYKNKNMTPKHKQKLLDANLGKKRSEESKRKQSEKTTGVPLSDYHKKRISDGNKGISRNKGRKQTKEHIRNNANARRGKKRSEEAIRKSIESKKIIRQERLMMIF